MASFNNTSALTPYRGVSNNSISLSIKQNIINDTDYQNYVEDVQATYDLRNYKSKIAAGRNAIREAKDNKMATVTRINALNKSINANEEVK